MQANNEACATLQANNEACPTLQPVCAAVQQRAASLRVNGALCAIVLCVHVFLV
jgi:hypothetical protein